MAGPSFTLTIRGQSVLGGSSATQPGTPLDVAPIIVNEVGSEATGTLSATIEDPAGTLSLPIGADVLLRDHRTVTAGVTLFGGVLLDRIYHTRPGGGRFIEITATQFDWWLDHRILPVYVRASGKTDKTLVQGAIGANAGFLSASDYVDSTNSNCDDIDIRGGTLREVLQAIAEAAAADEQGKRRFYLDGDKQLHYFLGDEGLTAPYRIADSSYTAVVKATSGLVSLWSLRETGATFFDAQGYANGTANGTITRGVVAGCVNEPQYTASTFDGSTGFVSASGANLHPGDTFTVEFWFKRSATQGATQTMYSAGVGDVKIAFSAANLLLVAKQDTGANFLSTAAYTDTNWHHLVVARSPGSTLVYVDGALVAGTDTARTFAAGATFNIGKRDGGVPEWFPGSMQHVAVYSTQLSAATALAHFNQGISIAVEDLELETAAGEFVGQVYVKGANNLGSGWWPPSGSGTIAYPADSMFPVPPQAYIDRPHSDTANKKKAAGGAYLAQHKALAISGSFRTTGTSGWHAGQTIYVTSSAFGLSGASYSIREITIDANLGNGVMTYDIDFGELRPSFRRAVTKKRKR